MKVELVMLSTRCCLVSAGAGRCREAFGHLGSATRRVDALAPYLHQPVQEYWLKQVHHNMVNGLGIHHRENTFLTDRPTPVAYMTKSMSEKKVVYAAR